MRLEEAKLQHSGSVKQHEDEAVNLTAKQRSNLSDHHESQLSRHADTICMLEQQLDISVNKNKEYRNEIAALKVAISRQQIYISYTCRMYC